MVLVLVLVLLYILTSGGNTAAYMFNVMETPAAVLSCNSNYVDWTFPVSTGRGLSCL
jgi:C4-dicarboxylate transporter